jgi:hypothetical protein
MTKSVGESGEPCFRWATIFATRSERTSTVRICSLSRRTLTYRRLRPPAASPVKITGEVRKEPGFFASL